MNQGHDPTQQQQLDLQQDELPRHEWDFSLLASIPSSSSSLLASDSIGSIAFSPSDTNSTNYDSSLLATAGIARKIRVYNLRSLIECVAQSQPSVSICTPAKLSNVRFVMHSKFSSYIYKHIKFIVKVYWKPQVWCLLNSLCNLFFHTCTFFLLLLFCICVSTTKS